MTLTPIAKRELKNVGQNIWKAIELMEIGYGGQLTHDSGRGQHSDELATTWIFTFPSYGNAQIAVPMNRLKLSLLMRGTTVDGQPLEPLVVDLAKVEKRYVNPERGVASSVLGARAPFLNPSPSNPLLRVNPQSQDVLPALLSIYLGTPTLVDGVNTDAEEGVTKGGAGFKSGKRLLTADDLQNQLDRNAETGAAGELIAVLDEINRLSLCGCPDPESYVKRVALTDVGRGYDIESTWPGEDRCIEVKSTTSPGSDFFITENERQVLMALGDKAWLYRVVVRADGGGTVEQQLRNPMAAIGEANMTPVVWRVREVML